MRSYVRFAVAVLVVSLIGAGAYYAMHRNDIAKYQQPPQEPAGHGVIGDAGTTQDPYDVVITYTNDGFSPSEITIPQGTRVRFLNKSSGETWPASGVHPTHTLYPEKESTDCLGSSFDACTGLAPNQFFDFTFYYVGTWPFHDHEHAYNSGTITVTTATSTAQTQ